MTGAVPRGSGGRAGGRAHRRARALVYGTALLLTLLAVALGWALVAQARQATPRLDAHGGPLAEALQWPWPEFPRVTQVERETIRRELFLDEPLLASRPPLWTRPPEHPPLASWRADVRRELAAALAALPAPPAAQDLGEPGDASIQEQTIQQALRRLGRVAGAERSWVPLYDRGVLHLWLANPRAAERELETAWDLLEPHLSGDRLSPAAHARVLEAAILTQYARGHALLQAVAGEPEALRSEREAEAVRALRTAVALSTRLGELDPDVEHALVFYPLPVSGLPTAAVTNDLIVAYLDAETFHDCAEPPAGWPCGDVASLAGPCRYRDRSFCKSFERATPPFGPAYEELLARFYEGDAWGEEHRLWALSNAVDRTSENVRIEDPYLLYNFATLLVDLGKVEAAPELLDRALAHGASDLPDEVLARVERLETVSRVLTGESPKSLRPSDEDPKSLRAVFRRLYPPEARDGDLPIHEFEPVGAAFTPDAESVIDAWLFLLLWRDLLAEGDVAAFDREYHRLMAVEGVDKDFFRRWRREVTAELGERALARAAELERVGERGKARRIRRFLSNGGVVPDGQAWQARRQGAWGFWLLTTAGPWLAVLLLAALLAVVWLYALGLVRAHRSVMVSSYPIEGPLDTPAGGEGAGPA